MVFGKPRWEAAVVALVAPRPLQQPHRALLHLRLLGVLLLPVGEERLRPEHEEAGRPVPS